MSTQRKPTQEQQDIIDAASQSTRSMRINAYAGTGKTTTLELLAPELGPVRGIAVAFNKAIANELAERFPSNIQCRTLNALGFQALRSVIPSMDVDTKKLRRLARERKMFGDEADDAIELVRLAQQAGIVPSEFGIEGLHADTPLTWQRLGAVPPTFEGIAAARELLVANIKDGLRGKLSFDDQLYLSVFFGGRYPKVETLLVDESQDLSPLNHEQLRKCRPQRVIAVGDKRQAIYAWRGADADSMDNMLTLSKDWADFPLTTTFRCPQSVVRRQTSHAPGYNAAASNVEGEVASLPMWDWPDVAAREPKPFTTRAILCRNNAPLITLCLKLLARRIPAHVLGRDVGTSLIVLSRKICRDDATGQKEMLRRIAEWRETEMSKAIANEDDRADAIADRADALAAIASSTQSAGELRQVLADMFTDGANGATILSSIHKSKGREWDVVLHLDPFRVPSKYARTPVAQEQERNLRYVCETRTKHTLLNANLEDFG